MAFFAEEFGKAFIFKKVRPGLRGYFLKAGYDDVPYESFGFMFYVTLLITYFIYIFAIYKKLSAYTPVSSMIITFISWFAIQLSLIALIGAYIYFDLTIKIYKRTKNIEQILPEYLQLVSANLKGGLS